MHKLESFGHLIKMKILIWLVRAESEVSAHLTSSQLLTTQSLVQDGPLSDQGLESRAETVRCGSNISTSPGSMKGRLVQNAHSRTLS